MPQPHDNDGTVKNRPGKRELNNNSRDFGAMIQRHRTAVILRWLLLTLLIVGVLAFFIHRASTVEYTGYTVRSSAEQHLSSGVSCIAYADGFLSCSKDGISYTDAKGNAMWNQTYGMQNPIVRVGGTYVAVADYGGHIIYSIALDGTMTEIDTNLPVRDMAVAENGTVAAVLEDTSITWVYLYKFNGEKLSYLKTTMQKSGYPLEMALAPNGGLLGVSYLRVGDGGICSSVAFYNFTSVGQNYVDNFASGADYADSVMAYLAFQNKESAFALGDDRLVLYEGDERPTSSAVVFLNDPVRSVYYNKDTIALVYVDVTGRSRYRMDIYGRDGLVNASVYFDLDYKDILLNEDGIMIYNETGCALYNKKGQLRFEGEFERSCLLLHQISKNRYMAVSEESIDILELR